MTQKYTGWRAEMDRLWRQFVVQCESLEEDAGKMTTTASATHDEKVHAKGFAAGQGYAAKSIRRSVHHPKYDPDCPLFRDDQPPSAHLEALTVVYRAWQREEAEQNDVLDALGRYLDHQL